MQTGIEITTTMVLRQLPRNSRISRAVRAAAVSPSITTPWMAPITKTDWSNRIVNLRSPGVGICFSTSLVWAMMSRVETSPLLPTDRNTDLRPSTRTRLVCGW